MSVLDLFRRRLDEFLQVVVSLLVLLAAARYLVRAGSIGWEHGALFAVADVVAAILPGNVDVPVALLTGVVAGWFLLFALDVTKRVQTVALLVVGAVVAVWLRRLEHVVDASGREPGYFLIALVLTVAVTAVTTERLRTSPDENAAGNSLLRAVRLLQFPGASRGLFVVLSALIVVVTAQYPWMPRTAEDPSVALVGLSGVVAIVALGSFVQYRSRANVVALTPDGPLGTATEVYAFAGLYYVAKRDYNGAPTDEASEHALEDAISRPDEWIERGFDQPVQFAYLPESLLRRTVEIHSVEHRLSALADAEIDALATAGHGLRGAIARLHRGARRSVRRLLPLSAVSDVRSASTAVEIVEAADTVLLIFPFPEGEQAGDHVKRMARLLDTFVNDVSLPAKMVVTHADRADIATEDIEFGSGDYRDRLLVELDDLLPDPEEEPSAVASAQSDLALFDAVYPVAGKPPHATEMQGYDRILDELDRR